MLSKKARDEIRIALVKTKKIEPEKMDETIQFIDSSIGIAEILEKSGNPMDSANELSALHQSIVRLLEEIRALSPDGKLALDHYINEGEGEQTVANKIASLRRQRGSGFPKLKIHAKFQIYAEEMEKAASNALSEINVPRGRPVKFNARSIALHLHEALKDLGIEITTTDKGPFMAILKEALSELVPTEEGEAYRRHGLWAVSVEKKKLEVNWASMRVDTEKKVRNSKKN